MTEPSPAAASEKHRDEFACCNVQHIDRMCEERLKAITRIVGVERCAHPTGDIVSLRCMIHLLALRVTSSVPHPSAHPQQTVVTEPMRFRTLRYFEAVESLSTAIERAMQSGALVAHDAETCKVMEVLPQRAFTPFAAFEAAIIIQDSAAVDWLSNLPLLDNLPHESATVRLAEFDEWATRTGVAESDEVSHLLRQAEDASGTCTRMNERR